MASPEDGIPDDLFLGFEVPSKEETDAKHRAAQLWTAGNLLSPEDISKREEGAPPARMNLLSLPAWLALAERAGVSSIPARQLASLKASDYFDSFDEPGSEAGSRYDAFHQTVISSIAAGEMVRMEQVAPLEVKSTLSGGGKMNTGLFDLADGSGLYLDLHEDRFYTTFTDLGADMVRAYARPIVETALIDGDFRGEAGKWPAEFRIFVEDGDAIGVSNYYPQVSMNPEEHLASARTALSSARRIVDMMHRLDLGVGNHSLSPDAGEKTEGNPNGWGSQGLTLDFLVTEAGDVLFLEGGPAGLHAAHPCCFLQDGRDMDANFLKGVAWSLETPIQPLSVLDPENAETAPEEYPEPFP